ncbi:CACTA en-spm transposon protein [Cucumis melo var. makuwa]|uniref:CACTA en-spm transposon protein n=1 Tax=Cucumis melo var. makuwa TaxID=1194695 RepID=A0A5A7THD5_CUCMM|nr:CACTA en-spm transposon protein [Cucumis melo var. makuwa]TYK24341.1 CACTA en-spm transposon protein [Cucumis melo var. makuwa]
MDDHIEDDTLCRIDTDPTIVERLVVCHVTNDYIGDVDEHLSHVSIMSYGRNNLLETDAMFLDFEDDLDNFVGGSSSVDDNVGSSSQLLATPTSRRPFFVLDFNDQAMNSGPEEARANPPNVLVRCHEYWHFLYNHYMSRAFQKQSWTNKAARQKQPYNHSSGSKLFLQRQHRLDERKGKSIDRVELFQKTHVRAGTFVSQAVEDAHNQMLELQSQPTQEGSEMRYAISVSFRNGTNAKADIGHDSGTARTTTWSLALRICNVK